MKITKEKIAFGLIILSAALLRLARLTNGDMTGDAAHYSFRAIGPLDFVSPNTQTTPIVWFSNKPWWSLLSFHDHPPLVFWIQNIFFRIFNVSTFTARLPFALFGIGSIILVFLVARKLYGSLCGYAAAFILSICNLHVWISRIGYLESILIFFILLTVFYFLKALENEKYFIHFGVALGLAFLSKYTAFFLIPAIFIYLIIWKREILRLKKFWVGLLLCLLVFSPVIIYNLKMYQTRGHFDMQFASLFGQDTTADWPIIQRSVSSNPLGSLLGIWKSLRFGFSPAIFILFWISIIYILLTLVLWQKHYEEHGLIFLLLPFLTIFFMFTKTSDYFISVYAPFAAIVIGYCLIEWINFFKDNQKYIFIGLMSIVFLYVLIFTVNTNLTYVPKGKAPLMYSLVRSENNGFSQMEEFLKERTKVDDRIYERIETLDDTYLLDSKRILTTNPQMPDVFIFDEDLNWFARFWHFSRRVIYQKLFFISSREFIAFKEYGGWEKIRENYRDFYFIKGNLDSLRDAGEYSTPFAQETERILTEQFNLKPWTIIKNPKGEDAFTVYRF